MQIWQVGAVRMSFFVISLRLSKAHLRFCGTYSKTVRALFAFSCMLLVVL